MILKSMITSTRAISAVVELFVNYIGVHCVHCHCGSPQRTPKTKLRI